MLNLVDDCASWKRLLNFISKLRQCIGEVFLWERNLWPHIGIKPKMLLTYLANSIPYFPLKKTKPPLNAFSVH